MRNHRKLSILAAILILLVGSVQLVLSDAAPPQQPPGASIESGGFETNVRMLSEEVLIVVSVAEEPLDDERINSSDYFQGHVEATFWMQNQGDETESFDVWFPLGVEDGSSDVSYIYDFRVWVNGEPAEIGEEELFGRRDFVPWATWPVTFAPDQLVIITVSYDLRPTGYMPYGRFFYYLETGAGWWGTIGDGTVTVRLPYDVNHYNVVSYTLSDTFDDFEIDGAEMIWHFTDLEPEGSDNIYVNIMSPSHWERILAAEEVVAENPDSAEAYLTLAEAQFNGLNWHHGLDCCEDLMAAGVASYQQALELAPDNIDIHIGYLNLLLKDWVPWADISYSEDIPVVIASALALDPENEELLNLVNQAMLLCKDAMDEWPDSEIYLGAKEDLLTVLEEAIEANPDNERLLEIYNQFIAPPESF